MDAVAKSDVKPRRLGRGLSSLMAVEAPVRVEVPTVSSIATPKESDSIAATQKPNSEIENTTTSLSDVTWIAVDSVVTSPFQPRRAFDEAALRGLADSIRRSGLLQPVLARRSGGGGFELVAGERRWRAAKLAGLTTIPALVRELTDEQAAEHALVENVQREDLNPMERAWALRSLGERFGLAQADLAARVGLERSSVANLVRLTELEPEIAALIAASKLTGGHGKALLGVSPGELRLDLARRAARESMSVRALEQHIQSHRPKKTLETPGNGDVARSAVLGDLQRQIGQQLGTKVLISTDRKGQKGRIVMEFYGLDHFDSLLARLGVRTR